MDGWEATADNDDAERSYRSRSRPKEPAHPTDSLTGKTCRECGKAIKVCLYSPHERAGEATGISASRWGEMYETYHVGWICLDCAWREANTKGGKGGIGGGGPVGDWDFIYG